ncbi:MAG TPA: hypothetical protein VGD43_19665, partial [Micromonospora sp.]
MPARRKHVLYIPVAVGRIGLTALILVVAISGTIVATGRATVPLGAARSDPATAPPRSVARAAVLTVVPPADLPMAGVAADA